MELRHLDIFFQIVVFLLAISVHESAHAWTASHYGDPTARLLGRVSLNPIRHIDPIGTVLLPLLAMLANFPVIGWAKPTPVDPRNFKEPVRADIMTSVAGPVSNFVLVTLAFALLALIMLATPTGGAAVYDAVAFKLMQRPIADNASGLVPAALFLYDVLLINLLLGIFNLIPVPPLDGSHVFRHLLSESARRAYDMFGIFGLILLMVFGGRVIWALVAPVLLALTRALLNLG